MSEFELGVIVLLLMIWAQRSELVRRMAIRLEIWRRLLAGKVKDARNK